MEADASTVVDSRCFVCGCKADGALVPECRKCDMVICRQHRDKTGFFNPHYTCFPCCRPEPQRVPWAVRAARAKEENALRKRAERVRAARENEGPDVSATEPPVVAPDADDALPEPVDGPSYGHEAAHVVAVAASVSASTHQEPVSAAAATALSTFSKLSAGGNQPTFSKLRPLVMEGTDLVKYGRNGSPKLRFVRLVCRETTVANGHVIKMPFLCWGKNVKASPSGMLPLVELREVTRGATTPNFKRNSRHEVVGERGEVVPPQQCFTLNFAERPVDFYAPGPEDFDTWYGFMKLVLHCNRELEQEADAGPDVTALTSTATDAEHRGGAAGGGLAAR